jgi:hypothetical protein
MDPVSPTRVYGVSAWESRANTITHPSHRISLIFPSRITAAASSTKNELGAGKVDLRTLRQHKSLVTPISETSHLQLPFPVICHVSGERLSPMIRRSIRNASRIAPIQPYRNPSIRYKYDRRRGAHLRRQSPDRDLLDTAMLAFGQTSH